MAMIKMHLHHKRNYKKTSGGFSLVEVLLAVGLGALVILGATQLANEWAKRVFNRQEANYLLQTHRLAQAYVESKFGAIWVDRDGFNLELRDVNGDDKFTNEDIPVATLGRALMIPLSNAGGEKFFLKDGSLAMPDNYPEITPSGRAVRIYVRNIGVVGGKPTYEILTTTYVPPGTTDKLRPMDEIELLDIAQAIGPEAGTYIANTCGAEEIKSVYGSWSIDSALLNGANMMNAAGAYCPKFDADGGLPGYVGIHSRVSYQSSESLDYLYRVTIPDMPDANRMQTNLNMNGNDVLQVAAMTVDNLRVENGPLNIYGAPGSISLGVDQLVSAESGYINARVTNSDPSRTTCSFSGSGTSKVLAAGGDPCKVSGGVLTVTGGNGFSGKALSVNSLNAPEATINSGSGRVNNNATIGTDSQQGTLGVRGDIVSNGTMTAGQLYAQNARFNGMATTTNLSVGNKPASNISRVDTDKLTALRLDYSGTMTVKNDMGVVRDGSGGGAVMVGGNHTVEGRLSATSQAQILGNLTSCNGANFFYDYTGRRVNQSIANCMNFERR